MHNFSFVYQMTLEKQQPCRVLLLEKEDENACVVKKTTFYILKLSLFLYIPAHG